MTQKTFANLSLAEQRRTNAGDRLFLVAAGLVYLLLSVLIVVVVERDWVANIDVQTFLTAARSFGDGGAWFDLYAVSRATSPWPYAYPPLFALVLAPFVAASDALFGVSNDGLAPLIAMRLPLWLIDIAVGVLLYHIVKKQTGVSWLGRLGAALWWFSPVLFYHTAIQAHLESLWLLPTLLAYALIQDGKRDWRIMVLFGLAVAVKQTALLFAVPFGFQLLAERRWRSVVTFPVVVVGIFGLIALPFFLYSDDFRYMITEYVAQMPVQIQSWQVWTLAAESYRTNQVTTTFPTVRYVLYLTFGASVMLSLLALWRGKGWYTIGFILALGFFLTSHKAIGYHYPILLLWLIVYGLTARQYAFMPFALTWITWVTVSPYYADWANPDLLPWYAGMGTLNSVYFLYLLVIAFRTDDDTEPELQPGDLGGATTLVRWSTLLTVGFVLACAANPIRYVIQDQVPDALPWYQFGVLGILLLVVLSLTYWLTRSLAVWIAAQLAIPEAELRPMIWQRAHTGVLLSMGFLFFTWFTMNAEITRVIERGIWKAWGLD